VHFVGLILLVIVREGSNKNFTGWWTRLRG